MMAFLEHFLALILGVSMMNGPFKEFSLQIIPLYSFCISVIEGIPPDSPRFLLYYLQLTHSSFFRDPSQLKFGLLSWIMTF